MSLLPVSRKEMEERGWNSLDFLFMTADAYVDHPSFGTAILTRLLESKGYRVGVCAQPDISNINSIQDMGRPLYGVFISSGVVDSMVNNYTAAKRPRRDDKYSPEGKAGRRPDRVIVEYCKLVRKVFGDIPVVIGGVEASLRRFAHYDYWSDRVMGSILADSGADILVYGMGESPITQISDLLSRGANVRRMNSLRGTCVLQKEDEIPKTVRSFLKTQESISFDPHIYTAEELKKGKLSCDEKHILLPSLDDVRKDKLSYAAAFHAQYTEQDPLAGKTLVQPHGEKYLIQNPPSKPLSVKEMDEIYDLPFERKPHEMYKEKEIPATLEVGMSITAHRGCYGGCNFCAITMHQGRVIQRRSKESIINEAIQISEDKDFKGYIHDIGGPTANFHDRACAKQEKGGVCKDRQCMSPEICPALKVDHKRYTDILKSVRELPGIKKVFVRSGVRFDYLMADPDRTFLRELCGNHISGQLKVAPEHVSDDVLLAMGKPGSRVYEEFREVYEKENKRIGKKQYLVPYLISGHPGSRISDAIELALHIKKHRVMPRQVQDFYPTPGSVSTAMYHTGLDPLTFLPVHVPDRKEKELQRALLQFSLLKNRDKVIEALVLAERQDLIGYAPECLIRPKRNTGKRRK